jgi:hypothetical protein
MLAHAIMSPERAAHLARYAERCASCSSRLVLVHGVVFRNPTYNSTALSGLCEHERAQLTQLFDLFAEDSQLISNDVDSVKTHFLRSGRRSRLS